MTRIQLTKASLSHQKGLLRTYAGVLPSLDLKRRQISAERQRARRALEALEQQAAQLEAQLARICPMLAHQPTALEGLVRVQDVQLEEENLVGTRVLRVAHITLATVDYGLLSRPFWVDSVVRALQQALENHIHQQVARERLARLQRAERTFTQRFNLFETVLIPRASQHIRTIGIALADTERAAVVNAKFAKRQALRREGRR
jgi:V/A-type H+-transporting ATPase subunit D